MKLRDLLYRFTSSYRISLEVGFTGSPTYFDTSFDCFTYCIGHGILDNAVDAVFVINLDGPMTCIHLAE